MGEKESYSSYPFFLKSPPLSLIIAHVSSSLHQHPEEKLVRLSKDIADLPLFQYIVMEDIFML